MNSRNEKIEIYEIVPKNEINEKQINKSINIQIVEQQSERKIN